MMSNLNWSQIREQALGPFKLDALPPTLQLPALPHAVLLFIEKARSETADLKDLAAIVETDAGLTMELLKHVNSAFYGLRQKVRHVLQALTVLGLRQSKMFVITIGTQAAIRAKKSKLINQNCFWNFSLQKALFAREIAELLNTDADIAFAGALLQDYLLPVLTNDLFEKYSYFVDHRAAQPECLCEFEQTALGWDHALAAGCLAHRWKLPDELVCCILHHHRGLRILADERLSRTPVAAVALSALLPDQLRQHYTGLEQLVLLEKSWPALHFAELVEKVDRDHHKMGMGIANAFPLARRCRAVLERQASDADQTVAEESAECLLQMSR